jgi:hypothetical protein
MDVCIYALQGACQRVGLPAAGTGEMRRLKITFSGKWPPHTHAAGGQVQPVLGSPIQPLASIHRQTANTHTCLLLKSAFLRKELTITAPWLSKLSSSLFLSLMPPLA